MRGSDIRPGCWVVVLRLESAEAFSRDVVSVLFAGKMGGARDAIKSEIRLSAPALREV